MSLYNDYGYSTIGIDCGGPTAMNYINNSIVLSLGDRKVAVPQGSDVCRMIREIEYSFNDELRYQTDKIYNNIRKNMLYYQTDTQQGICVKERTKDKEEQKLKDLIAHYYSKGLNYGIH